MHGFEYAMVVWCTVKYAEILAIFVYVLSKKVVLN